MHVCDCIGSPQINTLKKNYLIVFEELNYPFICISSHKICRILTNIPDFFCLHNPAALVIYNTETERERERESEREREVSERERERVILYTWHFHLSTHVPSILHLTYKSHSVRVFL
jgi:hypothetical protein